MAMYGRGDRSDRQPIGVDVYLKIAGIVKMMVWCLCTFDKTQFCLCWPGVIVLLHLKRDFSVYERQIVTLLCCYIVGAEDRMRVRRSTGS